LESIEELEVALDAMEGIAEDGGELDPTNVSREARLRAAYMDWCKEYGKESNEARFQTFTSNYLAMEEYAKENGKTMQLNMYADCTEEEYVALTSGAVNGLAAEDVSEAELDAEAQAKAEEEAKKAAEEAKAKAEKEAEEESLKAEKAAEEAKAKKEAEAKAAEERVAAKKATEEAEAKKSAELEAAKEAGEFILTSLKAVA
jgi:membrane protein involved in colicin uptake